METKPIENGETQERKARRTKGSGCIFRPKYRDRKTGELREGPHWWIKYSRDGKGYRENTHSESKTVAERILRGRLGEINTSQFVGPRAQRVRFCELADDLRTAYANDGRRLDRLETSLHSLLPFFGDRLAVNIGGDVIEEYEAQRNG